MSRKDFLRLTGGTVALFCAGMPIGRRTYAQTVAPKSAADIGLSPRNSGQTNRRNLVEALTNSTLSVSMPAGDYPLDNSDPQVIIADFGGVLNMEPGARFVFTDNTRRGLVFLRGTGAKFNGLTTTFQAPPQSRVGAKECLLFWETVDTSLRNVDVLGSAGAGLLLGQCIRPLVDGAVIRQTMADGLHFANCKDARANDVLTEDTGDDGVAFVNYGDRPDYSGARATNIRVRKSGARGIAVAGQSNVTVEDFSVDTTYAPGLLVAHDTGWNTRIPANVRFAHGRVANAGRGEQGEVSGAGDGVGIRYYEASSAIFQDIRVVSSTATGVWGRTKRGTVRLYKVHVDRAGGAGFDINARKLYLYRLLAKNTGRTGVYVANSGLVRFGKLVSTNASKRDSLRRAFSFESNGRVEGGQLWVVDGQSRPTGYKVNASGKQSGKLGSAYDRVSRRKVMISNPSRLAIRL